jgi:hypothetical protein
MSFLKNKEQIVEIEPKGMFSPEDGSNVQIPCCLSALMYEVWEDFKIILESQNITFYNSLKNKGIMNYQMKNLQIKKKVFDLFYELI